MAKWSQGLEPTEEKLLFCVETGEQYYPGRPPAHQPMEEWGPDRTIRAEMLRHLLVEQEWPVHARGVVLRRVRITGLLDLESATVRCPVRLKECYLDADEPLLLESATVSVLDIQECRLAGLSAGRLVATKGVDLSLSTFTQPVQLTDADVSGGLYCDGATLTGIDSDGYAFMGSRMKVSGGLFLTNFTWRKFVQPFTAAGAVILDDAEINGGLQFDSAHLDGRQREGLALAGFRMKVNGEVTLNRAVVPSGGIGLTDANITGPLRCVATRISGHNEEQKSLVADGIKVGSGAYLSLSHAAGAVSLLDAVITGQLSLRGAQIRGKSADGVSFTADRSTVSGGVWLDGGFHADGAVRLSGVNITGMLSCAGATLDGVDERGDSLIGDGLTVGSDMYVNEGFASAGTVNIRSARIGGSLSLMPAKLAGGAGTTALDARAAQIGHELRWEPVAPVCGRVILEDASTGSLRDSWVNEAGHADETDETDEAEDADEAQDTDEANKPEDAGDADEAAANETDGAHAANEEVAARPNGYWPSVDQGQLLLSGFTYNRFSSSRAVRLDQRLAWIGSHPRRPAVTARTDFAAQPYEHLVQIYQQAGQDTEARKVAIARRRDLRWYGDIGRGRRAGNWLLDVTIRYGYETWRALALLVAVYLLVLGVFLIGQHQAAVVVPAQSVAGLQPAPTSMNCTKDYPCFYPAGYAIDTVIPVINIGQGSNWRPNANASFGWFFVFVSWAGTALGWTLATLIVAGYTGLARRVDNP